jgi:hypothetical protein
MRERIKNLSIILRVDTDKRRLERVIDVPDGAPDLETAFLVRQALSTLGTGNAGWREVPMILEGEC